MSRAGSPIEWIYFINMCRNVSEILCQIKAFQHVKATGESKPSGWQPGKPTLKPGPDLVGKVWKPEAAYN